MNNKFKDIKPIDLTEEETFELVQQIAEIEYNRNNTAKLYQEAEDGAIEFLTYSLEKDSRGKKGLNNYYKLLDMSHFKNLAHFEIRNHLSYQFRKEKIKKLVLEIDSLDRDAYDNSDIKLGETLADTRIEQELEENLEIDNILSKVDNTKNDKVYIKLQDKVSPLSHRSLTKLYYDIGSNKMLRCSDFKGLLFNSLTNKELEDKEIKEILRDYRRYMIDNKILGGAVI